MKDIQICSFRHTAHGQAQDTAPTKYINLNSEHYNKFDLEMSQKALDLAAKGVGQVSPSPTVGCVVVSADGELVGEGSYLYKNINFNDSQRRLTIPPFHFPVFPG